MDLSVIIPTFNGEKTLHRTLASLTRDKFPHSVEFIVVDNKSTDGTYSLASEFMARDHRVRVVRADQRQGISYARNIGVANASSRTILICDSDDEIHPGWLAAHAAALGNGSKITGGALNYVTHDGSFMFLVNHPFESGWGPVSPGGGNCGFHKEVFEAVGGFDESMRFGGEDNAFFWRAHLLDYEVTFVPEALIDYYQREKPEEIQVQFYRFGLSTIELYRRFKKNGMNKPSLMKALVAVLYSWVKIQLDIPKTPSEIFLTRQSLGRNLGLISGLIRLRKSTGDHFG
jgi:glycosyltransferase involved in cell wall biosynthesis